MPVEHQFAHKNHKKDILLARFHQKKILRVTKSLSANSFWCNVDKKCVFLHFGGVFWVKNLLFDGWHPLFFLWKYSSINLSHSLKKDMDLSGGKMGNWPQNMLSGVPFIFRCVFRVKCPFFDKLQPFFILWITFFDQFHEIFKKKRHFGWKHSYLSSNWKFLKLQN